LDKALIANGQIVLRFLGRQDLSHQPGESKTGYVRQAYEGRAWYDPRAQSKVKAMLSIGLGITDCTEQASTVDLLDEILNDRNGVAHPAKGECEAVIMDAVIKNLEHHQASNAVSQKQKIILAVLKHSREIGAVDRLTLRAGVE
jgi:hypothetical protein